MIKTSPTRLEEELWQAGILLVAGIDEAGRGAWAGPVMAGAVILPAQPILFPALAGVRDSKQMTAPQRAAAALRIKQIALAWAVGEASAAEIDALGILPATRLAMTRALAALQPTPQYLLMDYIPWKDLDQPHRIMPKGESLSLSIAAASVLAKTERDSALRALGEQYPGYGLEQHKGYGTARHLNQIRQRGFCPQHRLSFTLKGLAQSPEP
jgi:ribonuclease HII